MSYRSGSVPVWYGMLQKLAAEQTTPEAEEYLRMEESYREYVSEKDLELTDAAKQTLDRLLPDSGVHLHCLRSRTGSSSAWNRIWHMMKIQ